MTTWVVDLDGVVWRADDPVRGSAAALARLRAAGHDVVFATNNSTATVAEHEARLARHGIEAAGRVVSSAMAAASLLSPGETVLVVGEAGVDEAVAHAGAIAVTAGTIDTVVVGMCRSFDYGLLREATRALHRGARLVATNTDPTFPATGGLLDPGNGALVAAVETAGGARATVAGKPCQPMADLIRRRWDGPGICVGDRPETDGALARALGFDFALVLSGVTAERDLPVQPSPRHIAHDLEHLVRELT